MDPGGRLLLGADDAGGTADYVRIDAGGRLTVHGQVWIWRGSRILVLSGAHLEIGDQTRFNCNASLNGSGWA